jgi:hypothetical protein
MGAMDESAPGSVNLWSRTGASPLSLATAAPRGSIALVASRLPSTDRGVTSFWWALLFGVFIWLGGLAIGVSQALAVLVGAVAAFFIFLLVRLRGGAA